MVNPGSFQGARKEFLLGEKEAYAQGVEDGYLVEAVAKIQRRFFKRFPIDLPEDVEPSAEALASVDDDTVEPDVEEPDEEKLTTDEYLKAKEEMVERQRKIVFRKGQIKRWLAYQYTKDHDLDPKDSGPNNPYRALLYKLTGKEPQRPRAKTACNVWRKTARESIENKVKVLATVENIPKSGLAALRDRVARDMFSKLPEQERRKWQTEAQEEATAAQASWKEQVTRPPSTSPESRQKCILGLIRFMQPILDLVCEATGWKASFIAGGPEPAREGRLNTISIHSGKTTGDLQLDFGTLEREHYKKIFVPMFGRFLKKCYSLEECRARALRPGNSVSLSQTGLDTSGTAVNSVDGLVPAPDPTSGPARSDAAQHDALTANANSDRLHSQPAEPVTPAPISPLPDQTQAMPDDRQSAPSPYQSPSRPNSIPPSPLPSRQPTPVYSPPHPTRERRSTVIIPSTPESAPIILSDFPYPIPGPHSPILTDVFLDSSKQQSHGVPTLENGSQPTDLRHGPMSEPGPATNSPAGSIPPPHRLKASHGKKRGRASDKENEMPPPKRGKVTRRSARISATGALEKISPVEAESGAPKWFVNAISMFQSRGLEKNHIWMALVGKWASFEGQAKYKEITRLSATSRPNAVTTWIHRKRSPNFQMHLDLSKYPQEYLQWWTTVQPDWRVSGSIVLREKTEGDWSVLKRPGLNGLVNVLVGLFLWGSAAKESKEGISDWELAVKDCLVAVTHLL